MRKPITYFGAAVALAISASAVAADRVWGDHAPPYTFLFGNHIDTHQETFLWPFRFAGHAKGDLSGWFYVFDSGDVTPDGLPILKHCTRPEHYAAGCVAGWRLKAKPCIEEVNGCRAMFLYHYDDHPVWLLDPHVDSKGNLKGGRQHIPQPGAYSHMHWLTEGLDTDGDGAIDRPSSLAEVEAVFGTAINVPDECNVDMASKLTSGVVCPGYFLELKVMKPFGYKNWAFEHGGEKLVVKAKGDRIDIKTHLNILTSYRSLPPGVLPGNYAE